MTILRAHFWRVLALTASLAFLSWLTACTQYNPASGGPAAQGETRRATGGAAHDLSRDEEMGGHTLRKHVGRTDEQLRERLEDERGISAASTYTDRAAAEMAVGAALERAHSRVEHWLERAGGHAPNLVLDFHGDHPIGRTMHRGDSASQPCSDAKVVLRMSGQGEYYVLTSYPECRR
jgi:hypothetical protein